MEVLADVDGSFRKIRSRGEVLEAFWKGTEVDESSLKGVWRILELLRVNGSFCGRRWMIP